MCIDNIYTNIINEFDKPEDKAFLEAAKRIIKIINKDNDPQAISEAISEEARKLLLNGNDNPYST